MGLKSVIRRENKLVDVCPNFSIKEVLHKAGVYAPVSSNVLDNDRVVSFGDGYGLYITRDEVCEPVLEEAWDDAKFVLCPEYITVTFSNKCGVGSCV